MHFPPQTNAFSLAPSPHLDPSGVLTPRLLEVQRPATAILDLDEGLDLTKLFGVRASLRLQLVALKEVASVHGMATLEALPRTCQGGQGVGEIRLIRDD